LTINAKGSIKSLKHGGKEMESKVVYFEDTRADNTEMTFQLVLERLSTSGIKKLVLASTVFLGASVALQ
jgi:hypothetical protein